MRDVHSQDRYTVRCEWGPSGAESLVRYAAGLGPVAAAVVDVLSFTTCVSVAVESGMTVWPYRWKDESAGRFAAEHDAELAVPRSVARSGAAGRVSLSPSSIRDASGEVSRLVLPSPNGSTISAVVSEAGASAIVAASLRNAEAVGAWLVEWLEGTAREPGRPCVVVVPGGERWPDGSLRPAVEDLWGAGAVVEALATRLDHRAGPAFRSPEAEVAAQAWTAVRDRMPHALEECASGRELIDLGWADDVAVAAEVGASAAVPVLDPATGAFTSPAP